VITQQQLEQQQATTKSDQATVAMDKAALQADQVQLSYTTISAPISGRVTKLLVIPGQHVEAKDLLVMIVP